MSADVQIKAIARQHADRIQSLVTSHPDILAFTKLPEPYPEDGAEKWINEVVPRHKNDEEYVFVIENKYENIVGVCGLMVDYKKNEAELGYWIGYPYWNQGYATAAIAKAVRFAFKKNFNRVFARPLIRNKSSIRVLEKNGFRQAEIRKNPFDKWDKDDLIAVYEITEPEWQENSNGG